MICLHCLLSLLSLSSLVWSFHTRYVCMYLHWSPQSPLVSVSLYNLYLHVSLVSTVSSVSFDLSLSLHTILYLYVSLVSRVSLIYFSFSLSLHTILYLHVSPMVSAVSLVLFGHFHIHFYVYMYLQWFLQSP